VAALSLRPYRRQPLHKVVRDRKLTFTAVAYAIGEKPGSLRNVAYGFIYPSANMKKRLPKYLGVKLEDLFEERVLAGTTSYVQRKRREGNNVGSSS
jgi:hypothetical protein